MCGYALFIFTISLLRKESAIHATMELGLGFENEDYEVQEKDRKVPLQSYNAKVCNPLWFQDGSSLGNQDWEQASNVLRLQADHAYSLGDFDKAYLKYHEALGLSSNSSAMQRHFSESKARCLLHLGRLQECRQAVQQLVQESSNADHERQAQLLLLSVCLAQRDFPAAESVLHLLITSEPDYAHFWLQLADVYQGMQGLKSGVQPTETRDGGTTSPLSSSGGKCGSTATPDKECSGETVHSNSCDDGLCSGNSQVTPACGGTGAGGDGSHCCREQRRPAGCLVQEAVGRPGSEGGEGDHAEDSVSALMMAKCCLGEASSQPAGGKDADVDANTLLLMELTCLVRTRALLQSVEGSVRGFVRSRNQTLIAKIQKRLDEMSVSQDMLRRAQMVCAKGLGLDAGGEGGSSEAPALPPQGKSCKYTDFRTTWFSWIQT